MQKGCSDLPRFVSILFIQYSHYSLLATVEPILNLGTLRRNSRTLHRPSLFSSPPFPRQAASFYPAGKGSAQIRRRRNGVRNGDGENGVRNV